MYFPARVFPKPPLFVEKLIILVLIMIVFSKSFSNPILLKKVHRKISVAGKRRQFIHEYLNYIYYQIPPQNSKLQKACDKTQPDITELTDLSNRNINKIY